MFYWFIDHKNVTIKQKKIIRMKIGYQIKFQLIFKQTKKSSNRFLCRTDFNLNIHHKMIDFLLLRNINEIICQILMPFN